MTTALLIKPDGTETEIFPKNGTDFQAKELNEYVGGYFEMHRDANRRDWIIMNEEGKLDRLPVNEVATVRAFHLQEVLVGNIVFCPQGLVK